MVQSVKTACSAGDPGSIPGSGRSLGEGNGNLLQYSYLENSTDREVWWAKVHGVAKESDTTEQLTESQDIFRPIFYYKVQFKKKNKIQFHVLHYVCSSISGNRELGNSTWKMAEHVYSQKLLTHVQGRHSPLWSCRVDIGYVCGHEICNLLQCQQACGILPLLELFLYHWLQFFTESLIKGKLKQWDTRQW